MWSVNGGRGEGGMSNTHMHMHTTHNTHTTQHTSVLGWISSQRMSQSSVDYSPIEPTQNIEHHIVDTTHVHVCV